MLTQKQINTFIMLYLDDLTNHSQHLKHQKASVSLSREGDRVMVTYHQNHEHHAGKYFIYRKESDVWILEYSATVEVPEHLFNYTITGWLRHDVLGFVIKICNESVDRDGVTYQYKLEDEEYVLEVTTTNSRINFNNNAYFIEEAF